MRPSFEFEALRRSFALRHQLLASTIGTAEVNELFAAGNRQTVHDRLKAGTLLGILDQEKWCFPLWTLYVRQRLDKPPT